MLKPRLALTLVALTLSLAACGAPTPPPDVLTAAAVKAVPAIMAFTASPSSLPYGGGNVTLAWTVSGASSLSIDQGVGTVTGTTSKAVAVPTTRTFTLTARNKWGSSARSVTVAVQEPITVGGTVRDQLGQALPGVTVTVVGHPAVVTDTGGTFSVPGVAQPYTLVVTQPAGGQTLVYQGARTASPSVRLSSPQERPYSTNVSGNLTGSVMGGAETSLLLTAGGTSTRVPTQDSLYALTHTWTQGESAAALLHALQFVRNPGTGRTERYSAYGETTVKLLNGMNLAYDVLLNPVGQGVIGGGVSFPAGYTPSQQALYMTYPRSTASGYVTGGDTHPLELFTPAAPGFQFVTPDVPGATFGVMASAAGPSGERASVFRQNLGARTDGLILSVTAAPTLLQPGSGPLADPANTTFSWDDSVSGLYRVSFLNDVALQQVTVYTEGRQASLRGTGVRFAPGAQVEWSVTRQQPLVSVDGLLGTPTPATEGSSATSAPRTFTAP